MKSFFQSLGKFVRKLFTMIGILVVLGAIIYPFRFAILGELGERLIHQDRLTHANALCILGAGTYERCKEGATIWRKNIVGKIIVTGGNNSPSARVLMPDMNLTYADLSSIGLRKMGVDSAHIMVVAKGNSTFEEVEVLYAIAQKEKYRKIVVLTSAFHTMRTYKILQKRFKGSGIDFVVIGAAPEEYTLAKWWESEEGTMFVFTEYCKILVYFVQGWL